MQEQNGRPYASAFCATLALALVCELGANVPAYAQLGGNPLDAGRRLFEHKWQPGQTAAAGGDGLGPANNDVSCAACHQQGGLGGSGSLDKNIDVLSIAGVSPGATSWRSLIRNVHPGFFSGPLQTLKRSIVLHRSNVDPRYEPLRRRLLNQPPQAQVQPQRRLANEPVRVLTPAPGLALYHARRNAPALYGAGWIDSVPAPLLKQIEQMQPRKYPGISGRAAQVGDDVGRFGWRGQSARLAGMVAAMCASDLGLHLPTREQAVHPLVPDYRPPGFDLDLVQGNALVAFVASLPVPRVELPEDPDERRVVEYGRRMFHEVGCSACHMEKLGSIEGIFSDLLLHDMGPGLPDPASAEPERRVIRERYVKLPENTSGKAPTRPSDPTPAPSSSGPIRISRSGPGISMSGSPGQFPDFAPVPGLPSFRLGQHGSPQTHAPAKRTYPPSERTLPSEGPIGYVERVIEIPSNVHQEWRTPPLWGVRDSAPYLHDGRAETLLEAITFHGGEAAPSATRFFTLATAERVAILKFLGTLAAPAANANPANAPVEKPAPPAAVKR